MPSLLLAIGDRDLRTEIARTLKEAPALKSLTHIRVDNFASVREAVEDSDDISLIVMDYDLPLGGDEPPSDNVNQPVNFAISIEDSAVEGPKVLILGPVNRKEDIQTISLLPNAETIESNQLFDPMDDNDTPFIVLKINSMIHRPVLPRTDALKRGMVELTIDKNNLMRCKTWYIENDRFIPQSDNDIQCESKIMADLNTFTKTMSDKNTVEDDTFFSNYRSVGRKTREILSKSNRARGAIRNLKYKVGDVSNIWIRFRVPFRDMPKIPFEAILKCDCDDDENDEFQLKYSPVYRVVGDVGTSGRTPFLSEHSNTPPRQINCLVINASTSGTIEPLKGVSLPASLPKMHCGDKEIKMVSSIFSGMKKKGLVSAFDLVSFDTEEKKENSFSVLKKKFEERKWDIIHFCGHSFFQAVEGEKKEDKCYIILPGKIVAKPVPIKAFADWCQDANFVFLSSCQSAAPGFIHALAEKGIPTIVGYRWRVSDAGAEQFADLFYKKLFDGDHIGNIEMAFAMTQRKLKDPGHYGHTLPSTFSDNRIWASPMLVMQNV